MLTQQTQRPLLHSGIDSLWHGAILPDSERSGTKPQAVHTAAEHAFWLLTQHRHDPHRLHLPTGTDPAQLFEQHGPEALHDALTNATVPKAQRMICERKTFLDPIEAGRQIAEIIAARPAADWSNTLRLSRGEQTRYLLARVNAWTTAPTTAADHAKEQTRAMRRRVDQPPAERWRRWADTTGITGTPEWPQIATLLDELHYAGADTRILARDLAKTPAQVIAATLVRHQTGQAVVVNWRPWAEIVNPTLLADEGWADIQADLTRLQAAGTDLKSLASAMAGRDPARVAVALRNVLRHHSTRHDPEASEPTAMMAVETTRGMDRHASRSV